MNKVDKKLLVFHHVDLDGYGVKAISRIYGFLKGYEEDQMVFIEADYYGYNLCDTKINKYLKDKEDEFAEIIFGDISVCYEATAEYLNALSKRIPIILRDHHDTALWMNKYNWAKVREEDDNGIKRCGTYWIAEELLTKEYVASHPNLKEFIYLVDMFDTWKWASENPQVTQAKDLSLIMSEIGMNDFDEYIYNKLLCEEEVDLIDERMEFLLKYINKTIKKEFLSANSNKKIMTYTYVKDDISIPLKLVIINASSHGFTIAQKISESLKKAKIYYDAIFIYSFKGGLSIKCDDKCKVPANELIKIFAIKGGGHLGAAGGSVDTERIDKAYEIIFEGAKVIK